MASSYTQTCRCESFFLPLLVALFTVSVFAGCDGDKDPTGPGPDGQEYIETRVVTVGPTLAKCYGVGLRTCMVVDGGFFYDAIEGFEYETGYNYRLRIGKYDPWGGREPPQDASRYAYRLLEQLEKNPAPSTKVTLTVGPARVVCARSDDFCPVVNGVPYDDTINDFDYEAGYHYVLEANRYDDGRYVLTSVVSKTRAEGTEDEEITIDWGRVECGDGHPGYCKVFNGTPYRGEIVGFHPRHEFDYRLRVEKFSMSPDDMTGSPGSMTGSPLVPAYGYRWLETLEETQGG
ncbi:MAG: DUF4377 domain-containing protein [Gemmatimonadetes bacterium]|nr:DUF4377 domain-containing protein [Gemmatimonadota bacterium]MYD24735.1 DUF4377 domain-containing protein [Gemmatimonadota bacterium]